MADYTHDFKIKTLQSGGLKFEGEMEFNTDEQDTHNFTTHDGTNEAQAEALGAFFKVLSKLFEAFGSLYKIELTTRP